MVRLSRDNVLAAAKRVNPNATLILKYPQWYDNFHNRGYEVLRQTADFDRIWVGTETRDYHDQRWGGTVQHEAYFIMCWLGGIGGPKCGGGWYDWLGTTEATYLEQARQTILGGARESFLFCYGGLQSTTGPKNIEALRTNQPELFAVAEEVKDREVVGIAAYKPANSHPEKESRVFDFVGMLGLPLVPCHEFPKPFPPSHGRQPLSRSDARQGGTLAGAAPHTRLPRWAIPPNLLSPCLVKRLPPEWPGWRKFLRACAGPIRRRTAS